MRWEGDMNGSGGSAITLRGATVRHHTPADG